MAIRNIVKEGDERLAKVCRPVEKFDKRLEDLVRDMKDTLKLAEGLGLAAPQIGLNIRVVVIDLDVLSEDFPEYKGFKKGFINPHIIEYDDTDTVSLEEGCLSLPGISEKVTRPTRIHVQYLDEDLQPHDEWVEGYLARVMQHEFDHLDAKMFIDRISPLRKQLIKSKLKALLQGRYRCSYRTKAARR